jgi:non-specific serine/threonine protein kinase
MTQQSEVSQHGARAHGWTDEVVTSGVWTGTPARLRRLRARLRLSQSQLANILGTTTVTVSRWEQGHHRPSASFLRAIARMEQEGLVAPTDTARPAGTAPKNPDVRRTHVALPVALSTFLGRERELQELGRLLTSDRRRLLTLTGVGGCGKTRLAVEVAVRSSNEYTDGAWIANLAPVTNAGDLLDAVTAAFGLQEQPGVLQMELLTRFLQDRRALLVLDNCEHLTGACAELATSLMRASAGLQVLATSRQPIGVPGETVWPTPPLAVPALNASFEEIAAADAARLFEDRARLHQPAFVLDRDNANAVARMCRKLEGLPLAIELAVAALRLLPVEHLAARLDASERLLPATSRSGPARQQSLRATLDWSYSLLSRPEQELFAGLSVFVGGFSVEAAEVVCAELISDEHADVLDLLVRLVEKSLVERHDRDGLPRLRLLEPLREYGLEALEAGGMLEATRVRHAQWCLALVEGQERRLRGPEQKNALDTLEREHDNLRAALRWAESHEELELRLVAALWWFWFLRAHFADGNQWLDAALASTNGPHIQARVAALDGAACLAWRRGDHDRVFERCAEAITLAEKLDDRVGQAYALHLQATASLERGNAPEALRLLERSLALFRQAGERWFTALALGHLGIVVQVLGQFERAEALLQESVEGFRDAGDASFTAHALDMLGVGLQIRGSIERAMVCYREALQLHAGEDDRSGIAVALMRLASTNLASGDASKATRLFAAMKALLAKQSDIMPYLYQAYADQTQDALRNALDEDAFGRAWAEGEALSLADAIELALSDPPAQVEAGARPKGERLSGDALSSRSRSAGAQPPPDGLSPREIEVLRLLALGKSNRQIGEELTLSVRTVERHIANIYLKLDLHGRAGAAAYAVKHGLTAQT